MDISDTSCQHVYAQISDHFAFLRICTFTHTYNAVFLSTDRSDFSFQRKAKALAYSCQFFCLLYILLNWVMRTVKHDR